ncbi:MAG: GIY-YIG nuclease family protein [Candidatus Moranbacteria bacterium]|nr:GIY-YIG nuclease family protein [Candidatus Moranbacteria bacterium]
MYYVYIIQSKKDGRYYIGYTGNVEMRLKFHNEGRNISTRKRRPFRLVHTEKFSDKKEAMRREKKIKSYKGGNAFEQLIKNNGRVA